MVLADERLNDFDIAVTNAKPPAMFGKNQICAYHGKTAFKGKQTFWCKSGAKRGRYVVIRLRKQNDKRYLTLCEVVIGEGKFIDR